MRATSLTSLVLMLTVGCTTRKQPAATHRDAAPPPPPPRAATAPRHADGATAAPAVTVSSTPTAEDPAIRAGSAGRDTNTMPLVFRDACVGEDCETSFPALACEGVELRAAAADGAPVVGRVARGDTVRVATRELHVLQPGMVVVRRDFALTWEDGGEDQVPSRDTLHFAAGDTLYLLRYYALGNWAWWRRGRTESGAEFWAGPSDGELGGTTRSSDSSVAVALSQPRTQDWWRVEPRAGQGGWWLADSARELRSIPGMQHWGESCR